MHEFNKTIKSKRSQHFRWAHKDGQSKVKKAIQLWLPTEALLVSTLWTDHFEKLRLIDGSGAQQEGRGTDRNHSHVQDAAQDERPATVIYNTSSF